MSLVSVACCQVEVSATGRPLVQRSPTECAVSKGGFETSKIRRPKGNRGEKYVTACCYKRLGLQSQYYNINKNVTC
jgi:hypothetical protein